MSWAWSRCILRILDRKLEAPAEEVGAIMRLFGEYLIKGFDYENRNVRICFMGDRTVLEPKLQELMNKLERDSACKTGLTINIAINYGGRPEIVRAAQRLAAKAAAGELKPEDITEDALSAQMYTAGQKDPDFILRPSGKAALQLHALAGGLFGAGGNGRPVARFHPRRPRRRHHGSSTGAPAVSATLTGVSHPDAAQPARPPAGVRYFLGR